MNLIQILFMRICFFVLVSSHLLGFFADGTQDQTTYRANTLNDNADDIQKQLDNEARDRFKYGQPKTVWIFHFPTPMPLLSNTEISRIKKRNSDFRFSPRRHLLRNCEEEDTSWSYAEQMFWHKKFPECDGKAQSPVNMPVSGLIKARGARPINFCNYKVKPMSLYLQNDGNKITMYGEWEKNNWPLVYGGAAHSRRYLFHSLTVHWPSEHTIGGLFFPLETQVLHISADYASFEDAIKASKRDKQALLGVVNIYQFDKATHPGLKRILKVVSGTKGYGDNCSMGAVPISDFSPPFKNYACYEGSLPYPPCTESVLWLVRSRTFGVKRKDSELAREIFSGDGSASKLLARRAQPLNDRRVFLFH